MHAGGGELVPCRSAAGLRLLVNPMDRHAPGEQVTLALRPEKVALKPGSGGTVELAMYVGTDTTYEVRLADESRIAVRLQNGLDGRAAFQVGDQVALDVAPGAARMLRD